jgi:hypothetical protein
VRISHSTRRAPAPLGQPRRRAAGALAGPLLAGCASGPPFAYLNGARLSRTGLNTYDTIIIAVDGHSTVRNYHVMVDPGPHHIVLQSPDAIGQSPLRSLDLNVASCTQYWFEAVRENRLVSDFVPRVNYSEPISGCRPAASG